MRVSFNELAERELNDAARYYELERTGLGTAFIAEVQRCAESIGAHPLAAPVVRHSAPLVPSIPVWPDVHLRWR